MKVAVDQVWATPSTLHMRVIVFADDGRWRHKYICAVPVDEIPEEAIEALTIRGRDTKCYCDECQPALPGM